MKNRLPLLLLSLHGFTLHAREIRPPLYFLTDYDPQFFTKTQNDCDWHITLFTQIFSRKADKAFADKKINGSKKTSLARIFFGKPLFSLTESFAGGTFDIQIPEGRINPFVTTRLTPQFSYKDRGVILSGQITKNINECIQMGINIHLPVRSFEMKNKTIGSGSGIWGDQTSQDVFIFTTDEIAGTHVPSFAFRLDALANLPLICTAQGLQFSLVSFADTAFNPNPELPVTVRGKDMTQNQAVELNQNPATLIKNSSIPTQPYAITCAQALALDALSGDGTMANGDLLQNGDRARFVIQNNYTPLGGNSGVQQMLWLVPTVSNPPDPELVTNAIKIRNVVNELLGCVNKSAQETLAACNIFITDQKHHGLGDLDTHVFMRYFFTDRWYMQSTVGLRLPTAHKIDGNKLLEQPLGNNGHIELHLQYGMDAALYGWLPTSWGYTTVHADMQYAYVTPTTEKIPASFIGAVVKNLGPVVEAKTSWHHITAQLAKDWHPINTECHDLALGLRYQLYHKTTDHITFKIIETNNCVGVRQELDARVARAHTAQTAHTIGFGADYYWNTQAYTWINGVHLFGGAHWVIGGKNIPQERSWHIGFDLMM